MLMPPCKENCSQLSLPPPRAVYLHVPFCRAKCRYCDFYSLEFRDDLAKAFVPAVKAELQTHLDCLELPLTSVFVGGGTPTALGGKLLGILLSAVAPLTNPQTEFTVEVNPATVDEAVADALVSAGVNRVNLGVQSFQPAELRLLGRIHTPSQADSTIELLQAAGITNLGMDLIYGIPGQSLSSWRNSLVRALEHPLQHLSCYALSFEKATPLAADLAAGDIAEMDEVLQETCYLAAIEAARRAGLEHYEISNFARPGCQCRHNLLYWRNESYLGIGPAATSYVNGFRRTNLPDAAAYCRALSSGDLPEATSEHLTGRKAMAETLMLNLRLTQGVDRKAFKRRFGQGPIAAFPDSTSRYIEQAALLVSPSHIRLA
ncbi:MAG: radical SAM family heme chaperone HemW, partial [Phycisphaerae bacterium]|nr:radical SAM family heme chaperone HemW [Phycisphaerae bacterium]